MKIDAPTLRRAALAYIHFREKGWSRNAALGIVANLFAESGIQASRPQGGGGPAFGLAQWEGPRQAAFKAWAGHDIHVSTFLEQLDFIQHELESSERGAGFALRMSTTPEEAAAVFCDRYERPADIPGQMRKRAEYATDFAALIPPFDNVTGSAQTTAPAQQ